MTYSTLFTILGIIGAALILTFAFIFPFIERKRRVKYFRKELEKRINPNIELLEKTHTEVEKGVWVNKEQEPMDRKKEIEQHYLPIPSAEIPIGERSEIMIEIAQSEIKNEFFTESEQKEIIEEIKEDKTKDIRLKLFLEVLLNSTMNLEYQLELLLKYLKEE